MGRGIYLNIDLHIMPIFFMFIEFLFLEQWSGLVSSTVPSVNLIFGVVSGLMLFNFSWFLVTIIGQNKTVLSYLTVDYVTTGVLSRLGVIPQT